MRVRAVRFFPVRVSIFRERASERASDGIKKNEVDTVVVYVNDTATSSHRCYSVKPPGVEHFMLCGSVVVVFVPSSCSSYERGGRTVGGKRMSSPLFGCLPRCCRASASEEAGDATTHERAESSPQNKSFFPLGMTYSRQETRHSSLLRSRLARRRHIFRNFFLSAFVSELLVSASTLRLDKALSDRAWLLSSFHL